MSIFVKFSQQTHEKEYYVRPFFFNLVPYSNLVKFIFHHFVLDTSHYKVSS
jgi:hypothetical protein